jgi:starch-binding outer membrane protein, SusD/RagB family
MMKVVQFFLLITLFAGSGCKKFLTENSQDLQVANTAERLQEVLVGSGYMPHFTTPPTTSYTGQTPMYWPWLNSMDDDITEFVSGPYYLDTRDESFGFYTWQKNPFVSKTYNVQNDDTWAKAYTNINAVTTIAEKANTLTDNPALLHTLRGEALFLRAEYYFYMVNVYAKAYDPKTAATDLGVPLKTTEFVEDHFFTRSTVDSVYKQILADLGEAETLLTNVTQPSIYHADVNAVNLLQSRVYLYMQDWQNAVTAADKVIARKPALYDLSGYQLHTSFYASSSPEAIFTQGGNAMIVAMYENGLKTYQPSPDLMNLYDPTDLRRVAFFEVDNSGKYRYTKMYRSTTYNVQPTEIFSDNYFMRNAEAYLNKAEAAAMLGQTADANTAINTLRQARFRPVDFTAVSLSGADLVNFIRDERRRELCFEGHRWFDLKRYAINPQYPFTKTIVHTYSDAATFGSPVVLKATLTLLPGDPDYLIPIPDEAIQFNQGVLVQNPERQDRTF